MNSEGQLPGHGSGPHFGKCPVTVNFFLGKYFWEHNSLFAPCIILPAITLVWYYSLFSYSSKGLKELEVCLALFFFFFIQVLLTAEDDTAFGKIISPANLLFSAEGGPSFNC